MSEHVEEPGVVSTLHVVHVPEPRFLHRESVGCVAEPARRSAVDRGHAEVAQQADRAGFDDTAFALARRRVVDSDPEKRKRSDPGTDRSLQLVFTGPRGAIDTRLLAPGLSYG